MSAPLGSWRALERFRRLQRVAAIYRAAVDRGAPPGVAIATELRVSRSTAGRWIRDARDVHMLPPTGPGQTVAHRGEHRPRSARWTDASQSWLACAACRQPWPCPKAQA